MDFRFWFAVALLGVSISVLYFAMKRKFAEEARKSRSPFSEKLLRPPGESLRLRIDHISDSMLSTCMMIGGLVVLPVLVIVNIPVETLPSGLVLFLSIPALCYAFAVVQWRKLCRLRDELRNYQLGFDGERYVGTELNQLMSRGYRVYHDFVFDMKAGGDKTTFNIDHIAVGPEGVFAIETKTRRKPKGSRVEGQEPHEVIYTGTALKFPSGFEDRGSIAQALRNAGDLSKWLTGSSATRTSVGAVVAIPGWMVDRTGKGAVSVLSARGIASVIPGLGNVRLSQKQVNQIADRIESHCRDIEGA
jgi:hypothetical protein